MDFNVVFFRPLVLLCGCTLGQYLGGGAESVHHAVVTARGRQELGRRADRGQVLQQMIDILVAGQPGVHVPRLQVAGDDAYELAVGEQVPDDAAVLEHGLDAARPH